MNSSQAAPRPAPAKVTRHPSLPWFRAECPCGMRGMWVSRRAQAETSAYAHRCPAQPAPVLPPASAPSWDAQRARLTKARKVMETLSRHGISTAMAERMTDEEWETVRIAAGLNPPSPEPASRGVSTLTRAVVFELLAARQECVLADAFARFEA